MSLSVAIQRVVLKDYKSIAYCDVPLGPLTFLVGPNGSGKSNFLDSLRFVSDALRVSLEYALRERGGINDVRRRPGGRSHHFAVRLEVEVASRYRYEYSFQIGEKKDKGFVVQRERCVWSDSHGDPLWGGSYEIDFGKVRTPDIPLPPEASRDQLYLVRLSSAEQLQPLFRVLSSMGFYSLNPDRIRDLQPTDSGQILFRDGSNLASVLSAMQRQHGAQFDRMVEFLRAVVPSINTVSPLLLGPKETIEFVESIQVGNQKRKFLAASMSDGTLRALGVIAALLQRANGGRFLAPIGIEEPELALHPAAAGVLLGCLREASRSRQIMVTSHSPDLLDSSDLSGAGILAVMMQRGETIIGEPPEKLRQLMTKKIATPGHILRTGHLQPDLGNLPPQDHRQVDLFRSR